MYEWRRKPPHTVDYLTSITAKVSPNVRVDAYFIFATDLADSRPDAGLSERFVRGRMMADVSKDNVLGKTVVALRVVA